VAAGNNFGNNCRQETVYIDTASSPAATAATGLAAMQGLRRGRSIQQADAIQAYVQAAVDESAGSVGIRLPSCLHLPSWSDIQDPVVLLRKSLYGMPTSGRQLKLHLADTMQKVKGWPNVVTRSDVTITAYVGDLVNVGPTKDLPAAWKDVRKFIATEEPSDFSRYLGTSHEVSEVKGKCSSGQVLGKSLTFDMSSYIDSCFTHYEECTRVSIHKPSAALASAGLALIGFRIGQGSRT
jgi:hypothetical protein